MRSYKTEGIILKRSNYGEADRILTVFTRNHGKIKVLAKGVRRIKSRRGPNVELFNWAILFLTKGKNFDLLSEAEVKDTFSEVRSDLVKVGSAYYLCELIDNLCPERQEHKDVFDLLTESFKSLPFSDQQSFLSDFKLSLLIKLGYWSKDRPALEDSERFIEEIIQRRLKTPKFLTHLQAL